MTPLDRAQSLLDEFRKQEQPLPDTVADWLRDQLVYEFEAVEKAAYMRGHNVGRQFEMAGAAGGGALRKALVLAAERVQACLRAEAFEIETAVQDLIRPVAGQGLSEVRRHEAQELLRWQAHYQVLSNLAGIVVAALHV
jgi:hypothetical protein